MPGYIDPRDGNVHGRPGPPVTNTPIFTNQMTGTSTDPATQQAMNVAAGTGATGDPTLGTSPLTGWAGQQGYTPGMMPTIYENPWYVLPDVFPGMANTSPLYNQLRDFGADPLALYNIIMGSQGLVDQSGNAQGGDFANFLQSLYSGLGTPGGQGISAGKLIQMLFGEGASGPETTLGQILSAGDMGTQVRTMFNLLRDVSNAGMNPLAARGYQAAVARSGDQYGNEMLKAGGEDGASMSFQEWANKNAPWLTGR